MYFYFYIKILDITLTNNNKQWPWPKKKYIKICQEYTAQDQSKVVNFFSGIVKYSDFYYITVNSPWQTESKQF